MTFMLTFDYEKDGLYDTCYPVVWKETMITIVAHLTYGLASSKAQAADGNLISASTYVKLQTPEMGTGGFLQVVNKTAHLCVVQLPGFLDPVDEFALVAALFLGKQRRCGSKKVKTEWKPILSIYITSDCQENEILLGATDILVIWIQDKIYTPLHRTT
ncbi:uncharacterized protein BJ212DRAFT_1294749 [Suillus subaureus]|uniref:Uncharacterized protein n=1 Tax=Suillus subaureus TaxID=48587 RepID=A0A9P7EPL9_9AGAM|nr:uncharacterized protein BJ212DRAFT_1294749 [Suillus subaureus]KAG1827493.1 hypothetical protein BJ212DRAFT_1294749 [Suillus subaureus]